MKFQQFANGDSMPMLGLGTWRSEPGDAYLAVKEAIRIGYRHIDCAAIYGNEHEIGRALEESFAEGIVKREDLWITSKLWNDKHAPEDVVPAIRKTLSDLRLDYLDLYLIHWPVALKKGVLFPKSGADIISPESLPLSTTWKGMEETVDLKLSRHIGVSNFSMRKIIDISTSARIAPEANQVEMHPYLPQHELLKYCSSHNIVMTAYSPLGSPDRPAGLKQANASILLEDPVIGAIAKDRGISPAEVLLAWAIARKTCVIPKSIRPERMKTNLAAADIVLSDEELLRIAGIDRHERYVGARFWAIAGSPYTEADVWA